MLVILLTKGLNGVNLQLTYNGEIKLVVRRKN